MDPNKNLSEMRNLATSILEKYHSDDPIDDDDILMLAELFSSMDEWILKGGFLPDSWKSKV